MADTTSPPLPWRTDPRLFADPVDERVESVWIQLREGNIARTIDPDPSEGGFFDMWHDGHPVGVDLAAPVAEPKASKLLMELLVLCAEGQPGATGPRPTVAHLEAIARVFREANDRLTATYLPDGWRPAATAAAAG